MGPAALNSSLLAATATVSDLHLAGFHLKVLLFPCLVPSPDMLAQVERYRLPKLLQSREPPLQNCLADK